MAQIRGQFPFPVTSPQTTGSADVVTLGSGGIWLLPPGVWLVTNGNQTVLQWYDPTQTLWRNYAGPETFNTVPSDGGNFRLVNNSGTCVGANITNAGSGGTNGIGPIQTGTTVSFAAPASGGAPATAQGYAIVGGTVAAPTIAQAGSQFLGPPLIVCDPPPIGGIQATFSATITAAGGLSAITQVNPGAGYLAVPQFYIIPQFQYYNGGPRWPGDTVPLPGVPSGTMWAPGLINPAHLWNGSPYQGNIATGTLGALLTPPTAVGGSGTLTGIVMTAFGQGYAGNTVPAVSFAGGGLAGGVAATAIMSFCATGATVTATGGTTAVTGGVAISSLGLIAGTNDNNVFFPRPMRGTTNAAAGSFAVEDPGYGLQGGTVTVTYVGGATLATVTNTQYGGKTDASIVQAMVQ